MTRAAGTMLPAGTFADRVAVVTGGGSGIGEAIARALAHLGATVVLVGRTPEKLEAVRASIVADGGVAIAHPLDVRDRAAVEQMVEDVVAQHGKIDHLVNSAAGNFRSAPQDLSPNAWASVTGIVLDGTWHCTQTVGRHLIARGSGGSVLNIGSNMANQGGPDTVHSASAKAGVVTMTKSLAAAWGQHGIRLNVLVPGFTEDTAGVDILFATPQARERSLASVPLGRPVLKTEVANAACYLLSDYAGYITGVQLLIDGGKALGRA
ncbi:SDR family oxidoreductase [Kribbia dieselivorans]|uniref:SDR family oxidoreductase n=1 Tax=Kribbia dieselivorans TaxID=331526 RepID=UPI001C3F39E4|nr:SDR family oxidoreductase [Kribbia dieselivorans]